MKLVLSLLAAELTLLVLVSVFPNRPGLVLGVKGLEIAVVIGQMKETLMPEDSEKKP